MHKPHPRTIQLGLGATVRPGRRHVVTRFRFGNETECQAREREAAVRLVAAAKELQHAGCFGLVLEGIPGEVAALVTDALEIPTIGIGAGSRCDGQVLVMHDLLGIEDRVAPKFVRRYADVKSVSSTVDNINASALREEFGSKKAPAAAAPAAPVAEPAPEVSGPPKVVIPTGVFVKSKQDIDREREAAAAAKAAALKPVAPPPMAPPPAPKPVAPAPPPRIVSAPPPVSRPITPPALPRRPERRDEIAERLAGARRRFDQTRRVACKRICNQFDH